MRRFLITVSAVCALAGTGTLAHAADALAIARANNCMTCHGVDQKKMMGPSFKEMSQRYKGKPVEAELAEKIRKGGSGEWGPVAMPAQPQLSAADARAIAKWIVQP
ncbi:MAG: c-type cytochrome [Brachymonas sp.]|nr:c-type cytochrome [Brachymonas sp.]